jgi:hypothetical protein
MMAKHTHARRRRASRNPADKPTTVEELQALHQRPAYQTMIARVRGAERERAEKDRNLLRQTIDKVMHELTVGPKR